MTDQPYDPDDPNDPRNHPDSMYVPPFSPAALYLFGYLRRYGGSVRMRPLMNKAGLDADTLIAAATELNRRRWINVVWRPLAPGTDPEASRPLSDVDRLCTTRFGRYRAPSTWPVPVVRR